MQDLTLVLVHGAFHGPECFDLVRPLLAERAIPTAAPTLPLGTSAQDVAAVTDALDAVSGPILLLGHSYGGAVISQASAGRDDVVGLVYLSALMPDEGETSGEASPDMMESPIVPAMRPTADGRVEVDPAFGHEIFYPDVDAETAAPWVARLRAGDPSTFTTATAPVGWHDRPVTYVVCRDDPIIAAATQRRLAARADAEVIEIDGDHSPFLARPAVLANVLAGVWQTTRGS